MKNLKLITLGLATSFIMVACKPSAEQARKYNDDLMAIEKLLTEKETEFISTVSDEESAEAKNASFQALIKQANESISKAEKIAPLDGGTAYLDAAKEYFATIKGFTNNEYKQLLDLSLMNETEITDEDRLKYSVLIKTIQDRSDVILNKIQSEQLIFATKYNFKIE